MRGIACCLAALGALVTFSVACQPSAGAVSVSVPTEIRVAKQSRSAPFPEARLKILSPKEGETLVSQEVTVTLSLQGFETQGQTEGAAEKGLANSAKGQHVHIIVDNGPYMACYDPTKPFPIGTLEQGTHLIRAFPSRSYHESVKTEGAFATVTFHVVKETTAPIKTTDPLLTYSRPKGEYAGAGAKQIMVDFYLSGVTISEGGNRVRLTVDGVEQMLTEWVPYYVTGLEPGEHVFKLELLDKDDKPIAGAFNSTERKMTVKEGS